jgi:hypothetical protein
MRQRLVVSWTLVHLAVGCGRLFYDATLVEGGDGGSATDAPMDGARDGDAPLSDGSAFDAGPGVDGGGSPSDGSIPLDAGGAVSMGPARCRGAIPGNPLGGVDALEGEHIHATLDGDCHVHATYFDAGTGNLRYAHFDGISWRASDLEYVWMNGYSDIAVDAAGRLYVVFNSLPDYSLKLATRARGASTWTVEVIEALGMPSQAFFLSLALGADGTLHVGYFSQATSGVRYASRRPSGAWTFANAFPAADYTAMAIAPSGEPHFAARTYADTNFHYAYLDAAGWHRELVEDAAMDTGWDPAVAVAGDGTVHIAFRYLTYSELHYAHRIASGWVVDVVDGLVNVESGYGNSIALDSSGRPHVAMLRRTSTISPWELGHAWHDGATWQVRSTPVGATGETTAIVIDGTDQAFVLYTTPTAVRVARAPS